MPAKARRQIPALPTFAHLAWQEHRDPTELTTVHMTDGERTQRATARRRVSHSKLWDGLCQGHRNAAQRLSTGQRILSNGLGMKIAAYKPRVSVEKREWSDHDADKTA